MREKNSVDEERHGIRIPGLLLDQIKRNEEKGQYAEDDDRFKDSQKRKGTPVSRKEKRKQQRQEKKQKKKEKKQDPLMNTTNKAGTNMASTSAKRTGKSVQNVVSKSFGDRVSNVSTKDSKHTMNALKELKSKKNELKKAEIAAQYSDHGASDNNSESDDEILESDDEDPIAKLKALKAAKKKSDSNSSSLKMIKLEDLDQDDSGVDDIFDSDISEESEGDPIEKLKLLKEAKKNKIDIESDDVREFDGSETEDSSGSQDADATSLTMDERPQNNQKKVLGPYKNISDRDRELMKRDEEEMEFYAKKLGLKKGKYGNLKQQGDDDIVGGLLDGLDFDFAFDNDFEENDILSSDGETYDKDGNMAYENSDLDLESSGSDSESDSDSDNVREDPFSAPRARSETTSEAPGSAKYTPPALRRKLENEIDNSETNIALKRAIKSSLNKLSEPNLKSILNELNSLYTSNSRHAVNEMFTRLVVDSIMGQERILDSFVYLVAALVVSLYRLQGMDFGAYFLQFLIEKFKDLRSDPSNKKDCLNILFLLSSVYVLGLVSSNLLFDIVKDLIENLNEFNAELLLRLIKDCGNQMRSDDPSALKNIIILVNNKSSIVKEAKNPRVQFLVETISQLKNNRMKHNEAVQRLVLSLKKILGSVGGQMDPIQVTLDDINHVETKGKWWLVGAAWKGQGKLEKQVNFDSQEVDKFLDDAEPNWMELAKSQKMNTDVRRAIFISILSATDYIDSLTKLDKLSLKRLQEREIAQVLIHCVTMEPTWNLYYGLLARKLCDSHSHRKNFQFILWNLIKEFHGSNENDEENSDINISMDFENEDPTSKVSKILNLGRFYGYLMAEGAIALHVLRNVNFMTASADESLFFEILFITFIEKMAKKSTKNAVGLGLKELNRKSDKFYDDKNMIDTISRSRDQPTLLKGMKHFINRKVSSSDLVTPKSKKKVEWGVSTISYIVDEIVADV